MKKEIRQDIIDEIAKSAGYDIALMTTFNYEIDFFERAILGKLEAQGIKKISLFVDANELNKSLLNIDSCYMGQRYMVNSVNIAGSFHPKVILLLGESKAKLFVGSSNIKTSGFTTNNEVFNCINYSAEHPENLSVIVKAIDFFKSIYGLTHKLDNDLFEEINYLSYYHKVKDNENIALIDNLSTPIIDQVQNRITKPVKEIDVVVPYYDNELTALKEIIKRFPDSKITLYIQNHKSTFPKDYYNQKTLKLQIRVFDGFLDNDSSSRFNFYHGKVFIFKTKKEAISIFGSANCTQAALFKTYESGGNIECDLMVVGEHEEFNYFLDNLDIAEDDDFESQQLVFERNENSGYSFEYGERVDNGVLLHFRAKKQSDVEVFLENIRLNEHYENNELIVEVPLEVLELISDIFEVTIKAKKSEENIRCWYFDSEELQAYRLKRDSDDPIADFEIDSEADKYRRDRIALLNAEAMCLPEIEEHQKRIAYLNRLKQEQEENDSNSEDFIVDVDIVEGYRRSYRQINSVGHIRDVFFKQMREDGIRLLTIDKDRGEIIRQEGHAEGSKGSGVRQPTSEEIQFERFVMRRIRGMMSQRYVDVITAEHYLGITAVVFDIFRKYSNVDIFDTYDVIEIRTLLYTTLLGKSGEIEPETDEIIKRDCFLVLLDNFAYSSGLNDFEDKEDIDRTTKNLLKKMEMRYQIRSSYQNEIKRLFGSDEMILELLLSKGFNRYVEELFGYKDYALLTDLINRAYDNAEITITDNNLSIVASSSDMRRHLKPDDNVIREIGNYSRSVSPIDKVTIIVKALRPGIDGNRMAEVEHVVNYKYNKWKKTITYIDGTRRDEKPEFLSVL